MIVIYYSLVSSLTGWRRPDANGYGPVRSTDSWKLQATAPVGVHKLLRQTRPLRWWTLVIGSNADCCRRCRMHAYQKL